MAAACLRSAGNAQALQEPASCDSELAARCFSAAVPWIARDLLEPAAAALSKLAREVQQPSENAADNTASSSSSSSSSQTSQQSTQQQLMPSSALLVVVLARSLVLPADSQEAAAAAAGSTPAQLFAVSIMAKPTFRKRWVERFHRAPLGSRQHHSVPGQWQQWQLALLAAFQHLHSAISSLAHAKLPADAPAAGVPCKSKSSSSGRCGKWSYLVDLVGSSTSLSTWQAFESKWPDLPQAIIAAGGASNVAAQTTTAVVATTTTTTTSSSSSSSSTDLSRVVSSSGLQHVEQVDVDQLHTDALELCRALVAAVPLPVVCNNPNCESLEGASEAAAASKMCAGCHCRYCSAACQAADWRRHRRACKGMVAAGQKCRR
ncbi:hypothetical protein COO60DRAFT_273590 [Scenedesmus sp. NREL 46B-D3]|nr:hypothetical protein COO60DRAFT_273590 [Scenedesmus sp. NREL 46B-D3]